MNKKVSIKDLSEVVASKANIDISEAEQLMTTLFEVLAETVLEGEQVKVKDFGTFKVTGIKARESVDVNTGEKIEIPAHDRVGFIPATALRELVNKPFAHFESVLLNEGISLEGIAQLEEDEGDYNDDERLEESVAEDPRNKIVETLDTAVELMQDDLFEKENTEAIEPTALEESEEVVVPPSDEIESECETELSAEPVVVEVDTEDVQQAKEIVSEDEAEPVAVTSQDVLPDDEPKNKKKSFKAYLERYPILIPIISGVAMAFASLLLHITGKDNSKSE